MSILISLLVVTQILTFVYFKKRDRRIFEIVSSTFARHDRFLDAKWRVYGKQSVKKINGIIKQGQIKGKVSEKLAERAFTLSNNTALAIMHLQKTLAVRPAYTSRKKQVENEKIQKDIKDALSGDPEASDFDFLYTILGDDERELVDNAKEMAAKYNGVPRKDN